MEHAAKVMASTAIELIGTRALIDAAKADLRRPPRWHALRQPDPERCSAAAASKGNLNEPTQHSRAGQLRFRRLGQGFACRRVDDNSDRAGRLLHWSRNWLIRSLGKDLGGRSVRFAADTYTTVLRGIPDLLVIFLFYFGGSAVVTAFGRLFGAEGFVGFPGFLAGSLAVGVTSGAQFAEVFRGAFKAVHAGEIEAAIACGMGRSLRFRRIIVPLTLRHALPGLGNIWQVVLKESALVSITGVAELLRQTQIAAGSTGLPLTST